MDYTVMFQEIWSKSRVIRRAVIVYGIENGKSVIEEVATLDGHRTVDMILHQYGGGIKLPKLKIGASEMVELLKTQGGEE